MKYKLLKDVIGAKAGMVFEYNESESYKGVKIINGDSVGNVLDLIRAIGFSEDFFEEVKEKKSIYGLGYDEVYWYLDTQNTVHKTRTNYPDRQGWKGNEHNRCFLTEREAKRNKLLRELATREKWLPEKGKMYITPNRYGEMYLLDFSDGFDIYQYHCGLVFRDKEEYNKWITPEAIDLLFKI